MKNVPSSRKLMGKTRVLDRNPVEFKTKEADTARGIMDIVSEEFLCVQKTSTIKDVVEKMASARVRRAFVTTPDKKLEGIVTAMDIVDFLGGGGRFKIISEKHHGNVITAVSEEVRKIMKEHPSTLSSSDSTEAAFAKFLETGHGALPVLENGRIIGIIGEGDFTRLISKTLSSTTVKDHMAKDVIFGTSGMTVADICKVMFRHHFRRVPILKERSLVGIVTTFDILSLLQGEINANIFEERVENILNAPITVSPETLICDAASLMNEKGIGGLPVAEDGKVVGMLTTRDLIKAVGGVKE